MHIIESPKIIKKEWGHEAHHQNLSYCCKEMKVNAGTRCSLHMHPIKDETFIVIGKEPIVVWFGYSPHSLSLIALFPGQSIRITPLMWHSFGVVDMDRIGTDLPLSFGGPFGSFIESSTHDDPEDCRRYRLSEKFVSDAVNHEMYRTIIDFLK